MATLCWGRLTHCNTLPRGNQVTIHGYHPVFYIPHTVPLMDMPPVIPRKQMPKAQVVAHSPFDALEPCPLEPALRFLAGTWTVKIMWYLDCGPRGFADLQRDLRHISPKVLSERLKQMEARGIISRAHLDERRRFVQYALTPFGREFKPVLQSLCEVAQGMS